MAHPVDVVLRSASVFRDDQRANRDHANQQRGNARASRRQTKGQGPGQRPSRIAANLLLGQEFGGGRSLLIDRIQRAIEIVARLFKVTFDFRNAAHGPSNTSAKVVITACLSASRTANPIKTCPVRLRCPPPITNPVSNPIPSACSGWRRAAPLTAARWSPHRSDGDAAI